MLDFIKEVTKVETSPLRYLEAKITDDHDVTHVAIWVITTDKEVFDAHPHLIKSLLDRYPMLHPRKITWSTHDPADWTTQTSSL